VFGDRARAADGIEVVERLLTLSEVAEETNTSVRFARRLVSELSITFVRLGRHVRIPLGAP
jgi:excisionase family DNA binding protein